MCIIYASREMIFDLMSLKTAFKSFRRVYIYHIFLIILISLYFARNILPKVHSHGVIGWSATDPFAATESTACVRARNT